VTKRGQSSANFVIFLVVVGIAIVIFTRGRDGSGGSGSGDRESAALDNALAPAGAVAERDGLAAAILIDVSGSMKERAGRGSDQPKIASARRAALDLVEQFARYADDHKDETVQLGIYAFSDADGQPDLREVIPMGPPDRARAATAVAGMEADGGTPIGNAMIAGKKALDATGLSRRHLLVVTDGENTTGPGPGDVAAAIARRPTVEQPSIYFVAFDIEASRFDAVRNAGGLVLEAVDAKGLNETLDSLLRGKILIER
jgi:Ca-activated chloride channel family protein